MHPLLFAERMQKGNMAMNGIKKAEITIMPLLFVLL